MEFSATKMNNSRNGGRLNLRKSLAWNPSFFTEEGVLDPSELSKITYSATKPNNRRPSKTNVESSSMVQFDKFTKRPPLSNLEGNLWSKFQSRSVSRSREKKATKLSSISEASSRDRSQIMLEKRKTKVMHTEKGASTLRSNYCSSPSSSLCLGMNGSMMPIVEKAHKFSVLPHAPSQANVSALRTPSSQGRVEKSKRMKSLFVEGPGLLKRDSCSSSSNKSPTRTSFHDSGQTIYSFSQQTCYDCRRPPLQIEANPSALRIPSPSLGFFQEKIVTSSHSGHLHKTSQVPISAITSMTSLRKPNHLDLSKPSTAKTDQQSKEGTVATTINVHPGKSKSTPTVLTVNGSILTCKDSEAHTKKMEIEHINTKGTSSFNVCTSSCLPNAAKETRTNCLSKVEEKTREVFLGNPYTGKTEKLPDEICSTSQISSNSLIEGCGMVGSVQCSDDFESTSLSIQFSSEGSDSVSYLRCPCISSSKISCVHDELMELSEEIDVQNHEQLRKIISQVQESIFTKTPTREECFNSSLDAQLILSGGCQPQDDLQLCELTNERCSVDRNVLMPDKKLTLDSLKQDEFLLKHRLSYVPYSEEWLAAIEAFGEDILEVKTGTVNNSPPEKATPVPGPWSPVKRKLQAVGPFDCTKFSRN